MPILNRGSILTSDIVGNELLAENVLEIMTDAVNWLLKPDGRLVSSRIMAVA